MEHPQENKKKDNWIWLKSHADTLVVLGAIAGSFLWMNGKFNSIELRLNTIETVLICKGVMPEKLCKLEEKK
jgi:hypothetical protein